MKTNQHTEISDLQLSTPPQQAVKEMVHGLPDDALSMAWRSSLNERLRSEAVTYSRRKSIFMWVRMPAAGLAVAGAMAMVFLFAPTIHSNSVRPQSVVNQPSSIEVEDGLFANYRQESASRALEGAGPDLTSESPKSGDVDLTSSDTGWSEGDAESL